MASPDEPAIKDAPSTLKPLFGSILSFQEELIMAADRQTRHGQYVNTASCPDPERGSKHCYGNQWLGV